MLKEKIDLELGASQALHSIYGGWQSVVPVWSDSV